MAREILIVDDEADIRMLMAGVLTDEGYDTRDAADGHSAIEALRSRMPSLVILDIWLQDSALDGLDVLKIIVRDYPNLPVVMISGHGTIEVAVNSIKLGAYDFIEKPFKADHLLLVVERAIEAAQLRQENEELRLRAGPPSDLLGSSITMNQLKQAVTKVAPTGSRVLITGSAGSGKEIVARCLHDQSRRATGRFLVLNCATMHPERMESELFGSENAWDGSDATARVGVFERAHGRRGRRHAARDPGQDRPRPAGADLRAGGRQPAGGGRCSRLGLHKPRPHDHDRRGALSRRPLLPAQRRANPGAGFARAPGGHPRADRLFHGSCRPNGRPAVAPSFRRRCCGLAGL
jgi:DNA-binding response OmpR family regulator